MPKSLSPLGDATLDLLSVIWTLDESLERLSRRMLTTIGVTGPQRMVLRLIADRPGISANDIAEILHLHPSTVSGIVRRLEAGSYLRREASRQDGRRWMLELTGTGRKIAAVESGTVEAAVRKLVGTLAPTDLAATRHALSMLCRAMEEQIAVIEPQPN